MVRRSFQVLFVIPLTSNLARVTLPAVMLLKALRTPVAAGASALAEDEEGRVLLVRHTYQSGWQLPGGGVESGEPPAEAVLRELREEIGLVRSNTPELVGVFTRRIGIATNLIVLYRVRNVMFDFKPNLEIAEVMRADPAAPPPDTNSGTLRRLAEHTGNAAISGYW